MKNVLWSLTSGLAGASAVLIAITLTRDPDPNLARLLVMVLVFDLAILTFSLTQLLSES